MDYLLLTVARDEEEFLPQVIKAIKQQSHPPALWMVVDDGSLDGTGEILQNIDDKVIFERLESPERDLGFHWGEVLAKCSTRLMDIAKQNGNSSGFWQMIFGPKEERGDKV